jgi:hypothetical protein
VVKKLFLLGGEDMAWIDLGLFYLEIKVEG